MSLLTRHARPFSSDTPQQKELLKDTVADYRQKMDAQWQELQIGAGHYGKQALVIGAVVVGVYLLMNVLLPDEDEEEQVDEEPVPLKIVMPEEESSSSRLAMGKALRGLAWSLAIGWARQKLSHYIEAEKKPDAKKE